MSQCKNLVNCGFTRSKTALIRSNQPVHDRLQFFTLYDLRLMPRQLAYIVGSHFLGWIGYRILIFKLLGMHFSDHILHKSKNKYFHFRLCSCPGLQISWLALYFQDFRALFIMQVFSILSSFFSDLLFALRVTIDCRAFL